MPTGNISENNSKLSEKEIVFNFVFIYTFVYRLVIVNL